MREGINLVGFEGRSPCTNSCAHVLAHLIAMQRAQVCHLGDTSRSANSNLHSLRVLATIVPFREEKGYNGRVVTEALYYCQRSARLS